VTPGIGNIAPASGTFQFREPLMIGNDESTEKDVIGLSLSSEVDDRRLQSRVYLSPAGCRLA